MLERVSLSKTMFCDLASALHIGLYHFSLLSNNLTYGYALNVVDLHGHLPLSWKCLNTHCLAVVSPIHTVKGALRLRKRNGVISYMRR